MITLHKYLTRQVLASLLIAMAVFTFVFLLGNALKDILTLLISGEIRLVVVLKAIAFLIPFVWVYALPMGLLTATLLVFGRFSADQELTAARASGVSLLSLITPVLLLSIFCCGLSAWINMDLGPRSRVAFNELMHHAKTDFANIRLPENTYIPISTNYLFYAQKTRGTNLEGVMVCVLQHETNVSQIVSAPQGRVTVDAANRQLIFDLLDTQIVSFNPSVRITYFKGWFTYNVQLPPGGQPYRPAISDMTFWQLRDQLDDLNSRLSLPPPINGSGVKDARAQVEAADKQRRDLMEPIRVEMNRQIAFSFACFSFTLIGIPLGIRVHRRETNIGVAIALVLVLIYYAFVMLGESLSGRPEFAPHLIFWLPNFIFQAVGAVLLWRANRGI